MSTHRLKVQQHSPSPCPKVTRPVPYQVMTGPSPTTPDRHPGRTDQSVTAAGSAPARDLILKPQSSVWRGQLGRLAWAALEDLAFVAHHTEQGWVAPVGVLDIAAGVGGHQRNRGPSSRGPGRSWPGRPSAPPNTSRPAAFRLPAPAPRPGRTTSPPKPSRHRPHQHQRFLSQSARQPMSHKQRQPRPLSERPGQAAAYGLQRRLSCSTRRSSTVRSRARSRIKPAPACNRNVLPGGCTTPSARNRHPADAIQSGRPPRPACTSLPYRREPGFFASSKSAPRPVGEDPIAP